MSGATGAVPDLLATIAARRRQAVAAGRVGPPAQPGVDETSPGLLTASDNPFLAALTRRRGRAVIAEIKMASPRLGSLAGRFDPEEQARAYARAGAAALSVVVEPDFFLGSYELLTRCQQASGLPALAKDFVVDARQIDRAAEAGAAAVLLVAAIVAAEDLVRLAAQARRRGLVPLVETHDGADVLKLGDAAWELVGINHRNLRTFEVDTGRSRTLVPMLPVGALRVAESGIQTGDDVRRLRAAGFDAFLVGESLLMAGDVESRLGELLS